MNAHRRVENPEPQKPLGRVPDALLSPDPET
jgi:hypothetical protein